MSLRFNMRDLSMTIQGSRQRFVAFPDRFLAGMAVCLFLAADRPTLDDERINERWQAAREFKLPRIVYHAGKFVDARADIGFYQGRNSLASHEFPWNTPGGRSFDERELTLKAIWPPDVKATKYPRVRVSGMMRPGWKWPVGTFVFELHYHRRGHPFELRVLEKITDGIGFDNWDAHLFRPFGSIAEDLGLTGTTRIRSVAATHPYNAFRATWRVTYYDDQDVDWKEKVDKTWVTVTGTDDHHAGRGHGFLSPRGYNGGMVGSERDGCAKCHDNFGQPVEFFEPVRDWYGAVGGFDAIPTFDPIDRRMIFTDATPNGGWRWKDN